MWARGQAWAIYGYTVVFRETGDPKYLEFAEKLVDVYLKNLPEDYVPYWDFNAPDIPNAPKDASAACVVASALLEMSGFYGNGQGEKYKEAAEKMLCSLSSDKYQSRDTNVAFLLHSTGHWPAKSEIDASIIYADYYYIEALLRLKRVNEGLRRVIIKKAGKDDGVCPSPLFYRLIKELQLFLLCIGFFQHFFYCCCKLFVFAFQ